jgi:mRNA interferase MazF
MVQLAPSAANGLSKESAADAFQVKSVSTQRFIRRLGVLTNVEIHAIASAIAYCIGYRP